MADRPLDERPTARPLAPVIANPEPAHDARSRRWLRSTWFWGAVFGVLPFVIGAVVVSIVDANERATQAQVQDRVDVRAELAGAVCVDYVSEKRGKALVDSHVMSITQNVLTVKVSGVALGGEFRCVLHPTGEDGFSVTQAGWFSAVDESDVELWVEPSPSRP